MMKKAPRPAPSAERRTKSAPKAIMRMETTRSMVTNSLIPSGLLSVRAV
jgi:hypothetical protein